MTETSSLTSSQVKALAYELGADRCGISSSGRFLDAPEGFKPGDLWQDCKSVVVFLKRMPSNAIKTDNPVIYSHTAGTLYNYLDRIGLDLCLALQDRGVKAVPVPTDIPYLFWDQENMRGMGILSLRHSAYKAGLGILGRNTLLIHPDLGNMIYIGAILVDAYLQEDPLIENFSCPDGCTLCLDACPVNALDGTTVNQKSCRSISCYIHPRGWDIYMCNECRKVCPLGQPSAS